MNRERKYRVWDKEAGRMYWPLTGLRIKWNKHTGSDLFCEIEATDGQSGKWACSDDPANYVIMDYAGLKDKNSQEIYEGDIIKLVNADGDIIYVVCEYGIARRTIVTMDGNTVVDIPGFYFRLPNRKKSFPIVNNYAGKHDLELFEVVGNIYQNPKLINPPIKPKE